MSVSAVTRIDVTFLERLMKSPLPVSKYLSSRKILYYSDFSFEDSDTELVKKYNILLKI